jgi:glycerol-3-phosphate acyltransferase PlsY
LLYNRPSFQYSVIVSTVLWIILAYLIGSIPVGVVLAKLKGKDPRIVGSGNIGATNVMRAAGKTIGILTLAGDILKGLLPVMGAGWAGEPSVVVAFTGLAVFLGHLFPVFLRFRGGKGVATAAGVFLAIKPLAIVICLLIFAVVLLKWRYVSLGSLVGSGLLPFTILALGAPTEYILLAFIVVILIFVKHRENIKRLRKGSENRLGK